jgi:hypothetical protein
MLPVAHDYCSDYRSIFSGDTLFGLSFCSHMSVKHAAYDVFIKKKQGKGKLPLEINKLLVD